MKCVSSFYVDFKFEHKRMIKSLTRFHPEVNLETLNGPQARAAGLTNWGYPLIELPLFDKYDTVTHIDADVIVVDRIDELFDDSTDVRAGRNNSDNNRCAKFKGVTLREIGWKLYVNCGIHSVSNRAFMQEWLEFTRKHGSKYPYMENDTFNILFYSGRYKAQLLDPIRSNVHYGTSIVEGTDTYWDLWREIVVAGDHLALHGKRLKMLHMAGGLKTRPNVEDLVSPTVTEWLRDNNIL